MTKGSDGSTGISLQREYTFQNYLEKLSAGVMYLYSLSRAISSCPR
ncbi:hypothetical protein MAE02_68680 [Microvirga aerophila]|uniref:Uncharacterized protein n=1 Tax=Microvirga aerophila TaxID=670291 RepID=A0A512C4L5_9HYPH|nr:hypothetical protein MAE02_68680 [Microvirga aerophila]